MRRGHTTGTGGALAALLLAAAAARAEDAPAADERTDRLWSEAEGEIRAGWRFLRGEDDGRFLQDHALRDGPRIFDLAFRADSEREDAALSSIDFSAHGIGDEESDARLRLAAPKTWTAEAGWDRDDFTYRATGDPFPYDTSRQRADVRVRWTPTNRVTVRLDWDRSLRRGDAWLGADTDLRTSLNVPPGVDPDRVKDHRPLRQQSDRVTLGVDAAFDGGFRASLAESVRLGQVDDTRFYDVPPATRGPEPIRRALRREQRSTAWTTVAKAGWTSADRVLDFQGIFSWTVMPTDARLHGAAQGVSNTDVGGAPRGAFSERTGGSTEIDRDAFDHRVEGTWRPHADWEVVGAVERESTIDDASLRLLQRRTFSRTVPSPVPDEVIRTNADARITDRLDRVSLEAAWDVRENLRLRLGEERLREDLSVPTDTRQADLFPTEFSSTSWRTTVGADWKPVAPIDLSLLVRRSTNDEPHTTPSAETGDEASFRARWKASETLSLTAVARHKGFRNDDDLDSASRSDSASLAAAWTHGALTVTPTLTWQSVATRTDTRFFHTGLGSGPLRRQVEFRTRDAIANLDVRYAITKSARAFLTLSWIDASGDYEARWDEAAIGGEMDLRKDVSVGVALKSWRLDEQDFRRDDYDVVGAEVWVTYRF